MILFRRLRTFGSDLLLIPSVWRRAVEDERQRRFFDTPEGQAELRRESRTWVEQNFARLSRVIDRPMPINVADDQERSRDHDLQKISTAQRDPGGVL